MTRSGSSILIVIACVLVACPLAAQSTLTWNGFVYARGAAGADGPFEEDEAAAQIQLGIDWNPSVFFGAHVHLLARTDDRDSKKGTAGVVEAFIESNAFTSAGRFRFRGGAMFLPTSFENIDSLWENPFAISSSALNTWFGEEFRPIGVDVTWFAKDLMAGATVFRGNDTLGALPPVRGWQMHDRWTLLGERVPVDDEYYTSVSAETDGRWGWSARGGWSGERFSIQYTHFDNRSDGREYGELFNWGTKFDIVGLEWASGDWTVAAETGWGPTFLVVHGNRFTSDIRASYVLVSKRMGDWRATARVDSWDGGSRDDAAITFAGIWAPAGRRLSLAAEVATTGDDTRVQLRLRFGFSSH